MPTGSSGRGTSAPFQVLVVLLDPQLPEAAELAGSWPPPPRPPGGGRAGRRPRGAPGGQIQGRGLDRRAAADYIGGRGLKEGVIEMKWRTEKDVAKVPLAEAEARVRSAVADRPDGGEGMTAFVRPGPRLRPPPGRKPNLPSRGSGGWSC